MIKPPENIKKEIGLIKMMIHDKNIIPAVAQVITARDFYDELNQRNFRIIINQYNSVGVIDLNELETPLNYLDNEYVSSGWALEYAKDLRDLSAKRSVLATLKSAENKLEEWDSTKLMNGIVGAVSKIKVGKDKPKSLKIISDKVISDWREQDGKELIGLDTSTPLNKLIKGYRPAHYWVIGAYTNIGKTAFACYLTANFIKKYPIKNIAYFSLEMTSEQVYERIVSQYLGVGIYDLRKNVDSFEQQINEIKQTSLRIYDTVRAIEELRMELMTLKNLNLLPEVIFIDFIQNMTSKDSTEYERLSGITLGLQQIAMDFGITVVALSQVSNEGAKNFSPSFMPFKGSGTISATADLGIILSRDKTKELENNLSLVDLEVHIPKNRHGRAAKFDLTLNLANGIISESDNKTNF